MTGSDALAKHPLGRLEPEDLNLIQQFVLLSGSIKDLAAHYGVSYPTMRARLDRLIERVARAAEGRAADPMAEFLADLVEKERLSIRTARSIRDLHRRLMRRPGGR